jgi:hypothetical protein
MIWDLVVSIQLHPTGGTERRLEWEHPRALAIRTPAERQALAQALREAASCIADDAWIARYDHTNAAIDTHGIGTDAHASVPHVSHGHPGKR